MDPEKIPDTDGEQSENKEAVITKVDFLSGKNRIAQEMKSGTFTVPIIYSMKSKILYVGSSSHDHADIIDASHEGLTTNTAFFFDVFLRKGELIIVLSHNWHRARDGKRDGGESIKESILTRIKAEMVGELGLSK